MSHMDGRASMPWSYPSWTLPPTTPAPIPRNGQLVGFKRSRSDTEDCDDAYSDHSSKDQCSSPGDAESCQLKSRKKRRGIIEKRRRDRINSSLGELRVLVPTLQEKQGSAKLEKAEILQMTVEYLKMMRPKGCNPLGYDSGKFAMDYHNIGFQECITEVAKYLSIEGLDTHDPLRMRLLSHLQHITTQREIASKQPSWYPATPPPPPPNPSHHYQSCSPLSSTLGSGHHLPRPPPPSIPIPAGVATPHHASLNSSGTSLELSSSGSLNSSSSLSNSHSINSSFESSSSNTNCDATPPSTTQSATSSATLRPLTTISSSDGYNYLHHQHPSMDLYHHSQHLQQQHAYAQSQTDPSVASQMKQPYRPWGAEVAY